MKKLAESRLSIS